MKYLLRKCEMFAYANVGKFHFTSSIAAGGDVMEMIKKSFAQAVEECNDKTK